MRIVRIKAVPADRVYGRPVLGRAPGHSFAVSLTRADTALTGRAYAAYGGIFIAASLMWLWLVEGEPPTKTDMFGAGLAIIGTPRLAIIDGSAGLAAALREQWLSLAIQRCTAHKLRNLEAKAPVRLREELAEDYRRMIYAETRALVDQARARFTKKWRLRCPAVGESLQEVGDDLFTFLSFPKAQWKALRTTNALERINGEFRRRTKTQASLPSQDAVLLLLFGLLRSGQMKMRKIDGWHEMQRATQAA